MLGLFEGSLAIGLSGLVGMAGLQFAHHGGDSGGHSGHAGDAGHGVHLGDASHGHLGDGGHGHLGEIGHGHLGEAGHAHSAHGPHADGGHTNSAHAEAGHSTAAHGATDSHGDTAAFGPTPIHAPFWLLPSPIQVFSLLIGFGLAGIIFRQWLPYMWTIGIAVANAIVFERFLIHPYWEFLFRFASTPAGLLQGTVATRAIAVTSFNRSGCGLVRLCVDGESRDVLARLVPGEKGARVQKGDTVFIEGAKSDDSVLVSRVVPGEPKQEDRRP